MSAYLIVTADPKDPAKLAAYSEAAGPTLIAAGGEPVFKGKASALAGAAPGLAAVFRFPNRDAVETWYASPEYQELIALREEAMSANFIVVDA